MEGSGEKEQINYEPDRFRIVYNSVVFKDIGEFVHDLANIFTQMQQIMKDFLQNQSGLDEKELKTQQGLMVEKLNKLKQELERRLVYVTDTDQVHESLTGKIRSRLLQFYALVSSMDLSNEPEEKVDSLLEFYYKRVLEEKVVVKGRILGRSHEGEV